MTLIIPEYVKIVFIYFENNKCQRVTARIFGELHPERSTPKNSVIH